MEVKNFVEYSRRDLIENYKDKDKLKSIEIKMCFIYENYHIFGLHPDFVLEEVKLIPELSENRFILKGFFKGHTLLFKPFQIDVLTSDEVDSISELEDFNSIDYECNNKKFTMYYLSVC